MNQKSLNRVESLLARMPLVFWDFDGVIKDSIPAKADAFERLFLPYGHEVAKRVRQHHEANGGLSRYLKMPIYLQWAGVVVDDARVKMFCDKFSRLVFQSVIDSDWIPGVREYLQTHYSDQVFVLLTATPQEEILQIINALKISHYFREIYGAPARKAVSMRDVLNRLNIESQNALMVGDSETDLNAANENGVGFLLRQTIFNRELQACYNGPVFEELNSE